MDHRAVRLDTAGEARFLSLPMPLLDLGVASDAPAATRSGRLAGAIRARAPEILAATFGVGWFLAIGGWRVLSPSAMDWFQGDLAQHVFGWLFFRQSHWSFPLGHIDGFAWPAGTTVGFTDSNPLLAIPGKLLSPLLPRDFQYVGLWLAACFALQGWFGARLAALGSDHPAWRVMGGALFALSPTLLHRAGHDTLCAHWAILALLLLLLRPCPDTASARRSSRAAMVLTVLVAAIHPYLAFMVLALALALVVRMAALDRLLTGRQAVVRGLSLVVSQAAVLAVLGYFTAAPSHAGGFSQFSFDLLGFINPVGASSLLHDFPIQPNQHEGYAYLGAGVLMLGAIALVLRAARRGSVFPGPRGWLAPLLVAALLMTVFALSPSVRAAGREVLDLRAFWRPVRGLAAPVRSSGRFVWPLYYLVLAGALASVGRILAGRRMAANWILLCALSIQVIDLAPRALNASFARSPVPPSPSPAWDLARGHYDVLALQPAQIVGEILGVLQSHCRGLVYGDDSYWEPLARIAYQQKLALNSGQLARGSSRELDPGCDAIERDVRQGELRPRIIYVVHPSLRPLLEGRPSAACGRIDGYHVCVASDQHDPFRDALQP